MRGAAGRHEFLVLELSRIGVGLDSWRTKGPDTVIQPSGGFSFGDKEEGESYGENKMEFGFQKWCGGGLPRFERWSSSIVERERAGQGEALVPILH